MIVFSNFRDSKTDPYMVFIQEQYKDKPFTFWYDKFPENLDQLKYNPYNFLFLHEPDEFFGFHKYALNHHSYFSAILTWNNLLLHNLNNAINFTYNGQTLDNEYITQNHDLKEFNVSFLCGTKNLVEGHHLRQKIYKLEDLVKIPKKWYYVLEDYDFENNARPGYSDYSKDLSHIPNGIDPIGYGRRVLFNNSMFNIVVENVKYNNWYNKIGDNFVSKTIPIYWGCPNIKEFGYDERGIIRFENEKELLDIINNLTSQDYFNKLEYIEHNYNVAVVDTFENNITQFFDQFCILNNL
jgi:hypothetical protein